MPARLPRIVSIAGIAALAWLVITAAALAQPIPVGPEFQVNQFPYGQNDPAVALDGSGKFVVVWHGPGDYSDFDYSGIQARRHDAAGEPAGSQFLVNSYLTSPQTYPAVGVDSGGNFVVVWWSYDSESDEFGSVHVQRYDAAGDRLGAQFQVNTYTTSDQTYPAVAVNGSGSFVVVWASYGSAGPDNHGASIQAQRYDAEGEPIDGEFMVNSYTTSDQTYPAVAVDADGRFVVVWTSYGSAGSDTSSGSVQAQRYDEDGAAIGDQFQVNTYTTNKQRAPVVASDAAGNFVVVWNSHGSIGSDSDYSSVQAQRYDAAGEPIGGQFQVNSYTTDDQYEAAVAMDAAGNFVVAWSSYGSAGSDRHELSIHAQRYDATGASVGGEFQVNSYTTYGQVAPAVAVDPTGATGNFVITWGTYSEYEGVYAQRFATPTTTSSSSTTTSTTLEPTTTTSTTLEPTTTTSTTLEPTTTTTSTLEPTTTTSTTLQPTTTTSSSTTTTSSSTSTTSSSTSTSTLPCGGTDSDGRTCDDGEPCTAPDFCSSGVCIGQHFCTVAPLPPSPVPADKPVRVEVSADPGATVEAGLFATVPAAAATSRLTPDPLAEEVGEPLSKIKTKRVKRRGRVVLKLKLNAVGRERLKAVPGGVLTLSARTIVRSAGREAVYTRLVRLLHPRK